MGHKRSKKYRHLSRKEALRIWRAENPEPCKTKADRLYFGYGSNLDMRQMKRRCEDSIPLTKVFLPGQILSFSNVLTIEPDEGAQVLGAIYLVSERDEKALDRYEGFPRTYSKHYTRMTFQGEHKDVFYYVLNEPYTWVTPTKHYYATVSQGYKDWGLDLGHLEAAYARAADAEKKARKAYYEEMQKAAATWQKSPNSAYTVAADGTIDYLDFEEYALDEEWRWALQDDMEEELKADLRAYGGWS